MQIELTVEQHEFIRRAIETGRVRRQEDAVKQALDLWVARERGREDLLGAIAMAESELARGDGIVLTKESMRALVEEVKRNGRERAVAGKRARG